MMKKKIFLLLPLICWGVSALSQVSFKVDGFSDKYYGKVYISDYCCPVKLLQAK